MIWNELKKPLPFWRQWKVLQIVFFVLWLTPLSRPLFTEFTNVSSHASERGRHDALERLTVKPEDKPIIAQIWGKKSRSFRRTRQTAWITRFLVSIWTLAARIAMSIKLVVVPPWFARLNFAVECIKQAKANTSLPVSVKTRLGFTLTLRNIKLGWSFCLSNSAALTVHLRTRKDMSKVPAHYEFIPEIIQPAPFSLLHKTYYQRWH